MSQSPHVNVIGNHLSLLLRGEDAPPPTSHEIANLLCSVRQLLNSEAFPATTPPAMMLVEFSEIDSSVPPPNSLPMSPMGRR